VRDRASGSPASRLVHSARTRRVRALQATLPHDRNRPVVLATVALLVGSRSSRMLVGLRGAPHPWIPYTCWTTLWCSRVVILARHWTTPHFGAWAGRLGHRQPLESRVVAHSATARWLKFGPRKTLFFSARMPVHDVLSRLSSALSDRYRLERELVGGGMTTVFLGDADGLLFYVMPYLGGESLRERLNREGQLEIEEAVQIALQVASALDYAHRRNRIQRDIKPENILLHEGQAMIADFGVARAVRQAGGNRLTETGLSLDTPQYMSPEQAAGDRELDARSDIYSLASVLYEMLAGEPPHTAPSVQSLLMKLLTERPPTITAIRQTVPAGVGAALDIALAKDPADRFPTVSAFAAALSTHGLGAGRTASRRRATDD
jgi:hypothetical protein